MNQIDIYSYESHEWVCEDKLYWEYVNKNPCAVPFLCKNVNKIDWFRLSSNPNAMCLLSKNIEKVDWRELSKNHYLFKNNINYFF